VVTVENNGGWNVWMAGGWRPIKCKDKADAYAIAADLHLAIVRVIEAERERSGKGQP
jgi:hypothetical protein